MRNLFIIGNGFDLAHNLKTSYNHFIEHIADIRDKDENAYDNLFRKGKHNNIKNEIKNNSGIETFVRNRFMAILLRLKNNANWVDIEKAYFKELNGSKAYENDILALNRDFATIKNYLEDYLDIHCKNDIIIDSYSSLFERFDRDGSVILNFNYTNTLERYKIRNAKIINIHGQLKNSENKIIFGYAANRLEEQKLIKEDKLHFLENIKRFRYLEALNEVKLKAFLQNKTPFEAHIIGHSMGLSDKQILKSIITNENIKKIRTYFYNNNYFETNISIHALLDESQTDIPMVPLPNCHKAPQHNDDEKTKESFKNFIERVIIEQHEDSKIIKIS